jgi:predicted DNA-binding transcriptional regulator AlpA
MQEEAMLRTEQAAKYLGLSGATLCKWRVFGGGPRYKKLGRAVVYDPADLRH